MSLSEKDRTHDLQACPFCGCHGLSFAWPREFRGRMVAIIECHTDNCYALLTADGPDKAVAAWNRRAEGVAALQQAGEPVEFEASIRPPPHWPSNPDYDRHPQTAEEWDWRTHRGVDIAIKRLNFAGDLADPRAPDQMALVLRTDLITLKHDWIWKNAVFEEWREERASLPQQTALVEQGVEIAAFLVEQEDEPLAADLGARMNYWRDKCITAGQRLDPKRWGPK